jgi:hypothetical protein
MTRGMAAEASREHPRTIGWLGTVALAMGGSNQGLFLIGSIVEAVIAMARGLKVGVIAEGVETREQAELLVRMGCTRYQGFLFSRPVHAREIDVMLTPGDSVVCCDEKPSIQALRRKHATLPAVKRGQRVEHEYERTRALCYLAAWDARRAKLFDRCAPADGIVPFDQVVEQFMSVEPDSKAQRMFVIVDNRSAHRGKASIDRLPGAWKNLILVHIRRLNQGEIYFSVVQRKDLTPNDFPDLDTLEQQLRQFGRRYEQNAAPFQFEARPRRPPSPRRPPRPTRHQSSLNHQSPRPEAPPHRPGKVLHSIPSCRFPLIPAGRRTEPART